MEGMQVRVEVYIGPNMMDYIYPQVFGVQYYGECWSGNEGDKTYSEYGSSPNCWKGVGGRRTNFVYEFVDDNKVRI